MRETKILCWNGNGIRAAAGKGFLEWLHRESPDILCLQETKAQPDQLSKAIRDPGDYHAYWNYPDQKGYSGVATLSREKPLKAQTGFGVPQFDSEGRTIVAEFPGFTVVNIYFPNGKKDGHRLQYKMHFYEAFLDFVEPLRANDRKIVICGDFNTAHKEMDLARPKENEKVSGFLPMERAWMDKFVSRGYVDTFRLANVSAVRR